MDNFDKSFSRMFKTVATFIAIVFVLILLGLAFIVAIGVKGCSSVQERGSKGTID